MECEESADRAEEGEERVRAESAEAEAGLDLADFAFEANEYAEGECDKELPVYNIIHTNTSFFVNSRECCLKMLLLC